MVQGAESADEELKKVDFSDIRFPSDRLTVGMLRIAHPDLFDFGFGGGSDAQPKYFLNLNGEQHAEEGIGRMLFCERLVAAIAYAEVSNLRLPEEWNAETTRDDLIDFYRQLGLATGITSASELVRDIERQGKLLAQQKGR